VAQDRTVWRIRFRGNLETCRKTHCGMNEYYGNKMEEMDWIQLVKDGDKL